MTRPKALRDRQHAVTVLAQHLATRIGPAIDKLVGDLDQLDGYPTTASGADTGGGGRGNDTTSSTERATLQRLYARPGKPSDDRPGAATTLAELDDWLHTAHTALTRALDLCHKHTPTGLATNDLTRLRCIGTGNATGATCTQWAIKQGRCIDCHRTWEADRKRAARRRTERLGTQPAGEGA